VTKRHPKAPEDLGIIARQKWDELLPELADVTPGTLSCLEQFCTAWSCWVWATDDNSKIKWSRACRQWLSVLNLTRAKAGDQVDGQRDPVLRLITGARKTEH